MNRFVPAVVVLAALSLAGCGHQPGERAVSGGLIGAGTGAVVGAVIGAPILGAAVIGGAIGAVGGAATSPDQVDLGKPAWK